MSKEMIIGISYIPWRDYLELTKPKVVLLMLMTSVVGMCLASKDGVDPLLFLSALVGIGMVAAAAACVNHLADKHIDTLMDRTCRRPVAIGRVTIKQAWIFAFSLMASGALVLCIWVNVLTAVLSLLTLIGYAGIYTYYLKRATPQNIVIGGLAGAFPPCLGWAAVGNELHPYALLLALIIFVWTPPHFWALAIYRRDDYQKAGIPMLPVTHGISFTKLSIVAYTLLLWVVSALPYLTGMSGWLYLVVAIILGSRFMYWALRLYLGDAQLVAMKTFRYSIAYLFWLYTALVLDHYFI